LFLQSALEFAREAELEQAMGANRLTLLRAVIEAGAGDYRALAAAFMRQAVVSGVTQTQPRKVE
jgi:hypothetical protein